MTEPWDPDELARELPRRDRVLVLFYGEWCPASRIFLPLFEQAEPEASVPFARVPLAPPAEDARWREHGIERTPTLVYFEHGEQLERVNGIPRYGLSRHDLESMLDLLDALQEDHTRERRWLRRRRAKRRAA